MTGTITATADPTYARVAVQLNSWVDTETVVYRVVGGVRTVVRAFNPARPISGVAFTYDYEVPPNTLVTYEAGDNAGATLGSSTPGRGTMAVPWLPAPALPSVNTPVAFATTPSRTRRRRQERFQVIGRPSPVVVSDVRALSEGEITLVALDDAAASAIWEAVDGADVLLV